MTAFPSNQMPATPHRRRPRYSGRHPRRFEEIRSILDSLGVAQIDLPGFLAQTGLEGPDGRPDGVHLAPQVRARFVAAVVVPDVLALALAQS